MARKEEIQKELEQIEKEEELQKRSTWILDCSNLQQKFSELQQDASLATPEIMWKLIEEVNRLLRRAPDDILHQATSELREKIIEFSQPIFDIENEDNEREILASLTPEQRVAESLHVRSCDRGHESVCGFYYEEWSHPGYEKKNYLEKARLLMVVLAGNEQLALKVVAALFSDLVDDEDDEEETSKD